MFRKEVVRVRGEFEEDLKDGGRTWGSLMKPGRLLSRHGESEYPVLAGFGVILFTGHQRLQV